MFGVVGHGDLTAESWGLVEDELPAVLRRLEPHGLMGVVRAAAGLPLVVVVPTAGALPAALPGQDRVATGQLLMLAEHTRLVEFDPRDPDACAAVDERIIDSCRGLVAVWDGSGSNDRPDVAHLVTHARRRKVPVQVLWLAGARRIAPCAVPAVRAAIRTAPRPACPPRMATGTDRLEEFFNWLVALVNR